jgi:hypothetical protein
VHPTLGIRRHFQAFSYASAFSQSDGVPPPAPARVTQTVGQVLALNLLRNFQNWFVFQIRFWGFCKVSSSSKLAFLVVAISQVFRSQKSAFVFFSHSFIFGFVRFLKSASWVLVKVLASKRFHLAKSIFKAKVIFS